MNKWEDILRSFVTSLNPRSYDKLSARDLRTSFRYFFYILLFSLILMVILSIPILLNFPARIQDQLANFNSIDIDVHQEMSAPFVLTKNNPLFAVDTTGVMQPEDSQILVTQDAVYYHVLPFSAAQNIAFGDGNLLDKKPETAKMLSILMLLLLPGILLLYFIALFIKYLLIVLVSAILGFILTGLIRFHIRLKQLLNVAVYAATPMIVVELLTKPYIINTYYAQYVLFGVYFILGLIKAGEFESLRDVDRNDRRR